MGLDLGHPSIVAPVNAAKDWGHAVWEEPGGPRHWVGVVKSPRAAQWWEALRGGETWSTRMRR